jgi:7-keto-8-aminopelargonate synthetase-like enzyme
MMKNAITLIKELTEENERLHASCTELEQKCASLCEENERLKNRITCQIVLPDEKLEEIKNECLERVELDIKAIQADTVLKYSEKVYQLILGFVGEKLSEQDKDYITVMLGQIGEEIVGVEK